MVLNFPLSACVHVTYGTWKMESKCEESEEVSSYYIKQKKTIWWKKGKEKKKEMKGEKERKGEKEKKGEKKKRKENEREKRGGKICAWRRKGKERKRALIFGVPTVGSC